MTPFPTKYILFVEDDLCVAELVLHVLERTSAKPRVVHVRDGVEALDFLHARGRYEQREVANPTVVLLDVKMPRLDGLEVLREVKSDDTLRSIPIVMLTSSQDERDIRTSYELGANAYIVKPVEFQRLAAMLTTVETFWMEINQPPPQSVPAPRMAAHG
jgi:CheY-like chemotaxis protein